MHKHGNKPSNIILNKPKRYCCGYEYYLSHTKNKKFRKNITNLSQKTLVNGIPIKTINFTDYITNLTNINSLYNPPQFKSLVTQNANTTYGIVNVIFPNAIKIQFVINHNTVINLFNNNNLPIINFNGTNPSNTNMYNFDAYTGSIWFTIYLYEQFNRAGIFNTTCTILSVVNVNFTNAFWNGYYMTYGNSSDDPQITPLTTLDIVGHEMMHGVTQFVNGLVYQSEAGAINESYSDIFGSVLEYFYDQKSNKNLFDWTIAEDAFAPTFRSMSNPKAVDQPDTYNGQYWAPTNSSNDYGGVHTNSGVGNYLFYICCTPTSSINDNATTYTTTNVFNILTLAKLFYNTLNGTSGYKKLPHNTNYRTFIGHLVHNASLFITNENLNINLIDTINEAARAINVPVINIIPPPINNKIRYKIRRRPRYIPKKKKILA